MAKDTKIKACRICLITDVKMHYIDNVLEDYISILANDESYKRFPNYICYECASLLMKFIKFRKKYIEAQSILSNMFKECSEITKQDIKEINLSTVVLKSYLGYKKLPSISVYKKTNITEEMVVHEGATSEDEGTTILDDKIKLNDEETELDDEDRAIADDAEIKLRKVDSTVEDESDDDTPLMFIVIADEETEDETDSQLEVAKEVEKQKCGQTRKRGVAHSKSREQKPKRTKTSSESADNDIDLNKYVSVIKLSMQEQQEEFNKRKLSSNYRNSAYRCNLCYRGFIHTQAWKHHLMKHDASSGDIECTLCKIRFKKKSLLNWHAKTIHEMKYVCKSCPHISTSELKAKLHQKWHDGVTYKCKHCDEEYTNRTSYLGHLRIKHPSDFICDVCGDSFVSKTGLSMHKNRIHKDTDEAGGDGEKEPGPYCKECDIKFVSVEAWNRHMVISDKHKQTVQFENLCRVCGKTFKSSEDLQVHRQEEHARKPPINFVNTTGHTNMTWPVNCEHCSEQFFNKREYWIHYRKKHPGENYPVQRNHVCDICGKRYPTSTHLGTHKWQHSEKKQFKCGQCGKEFYSPDKLRLHETYTHSDLRPCRCTVCDKAFKNNGTLERHLKTHSGEKPFMCQICGATFTAEWSRKLHVSTVHALPGA